MSDLLLSTAVQSSHFGLKNLHSNVYKVSLEGTVNELQFIYACDSI